MCSMCVLLCLCMCVEAFGSLAHALADYDLPESARSGVGGVEELFTGPGNVI